MKRTLSLLCSTFLIAVLFTACSKDDDGGITPPDPQNGKTMKITITATGLTASDHLTTTVTGGTLDGKESTLYRLNGTLQTNQRGFTIDQSMLLAGPVIIETVVPVVITTIDMGGFSTPGHNFSIKIEPVINGKAQTTINQAYTNESMSKSYTFE